MGLQPGADRPAQPRLRDPQPQATARWTFRPNRWSSRTSGAKPR